MTSLDVFISHSSSDELVAKTLISLIRSALNLPAERIRCTSVNGYRLPAGATTNEQLQQEIHESRAFIALITPNSLRSMYVMFELGARWGARKPLIPLLACGVKRDELRSPLSAINAITCYEVAQVHQLITDLGNALGISPDSPATYQEDLRVLMEEAKRPTSFDSAIDKSVTPSASEAHVEKRDQAMSILLAIWQLDSDNYSEHGYRVEDISTKSSVSIPTCKHHLDTMVNERKLKRVKVIGGRGGLHYSLTTGGSDHLIKSGLVPD